MSLHTYATTILTRTAGTDYYRLVRDNLVNTLNGYVQEVCPVSRPLKRESARLAKSKS
jgi:hypothetical protein